MKSDRLTNFVKIVIRSFLVLTGCLLLATCGGESVGNAGSLVGGPCAENADCDPDSICLTDTAYPSGTCALPCIIQRNCPSDTVCIKTDTDEANCLLRCTFNNDCRPGYECQGLQRVENDGEALVCIGPS